MKLKHLAVLLALSTMAADCPFGDKSATDNGNPGDVAGTYTLQKVNGSNLPANWNDEGVGTVQITAGSVVINANGTFSYSETRSNGSDAISGTWTQAGGTYTFVPSDAEGTDDHGTGTFAGTQFTLTTPDNPTTTRIYQKTS